MLPNWKPVATHRKIQEHKKRAMLKAGEVSQKQKVRRRDGHRCRFPLCGCRKLKLRLEVSHVRHKGMGGNPDGDRSFADAMVLLCIHRHQYAPISLHKGTLRTRALTPKGANGPIAWDMDCTGFGAGYLGSQDPGKVIKLAGLASQWSELAREAAVQTLEPLTRGQREMLELLAEMNL